MGLKALGKQARESGMLERKDWLPADWRLFLQIGQEAGWILPYIRAVTGLSVKEIQTRKLKLQRFTKLKLPALRQKPKILNR